MLTVKNFFVAVVALSVLLAAIGGLAPSSAQGVRPVQDVSVVNAPTVQAQQAGPWTVGAQLAPGSTVGISGTPTVSIGGTPTVNVASLPASGLDVRPALPTFPRAWDMELTNARPNVIVAGDPGARAVGLTSVTLTNFESFTVQVSLTHVTTAMSDCAGTVTGGTVPQPFFLVQAGSTLHLTYPTPLVFSRIDGGSCIQVQLGSVLAGGNVYATLSGFAQY